MSSPEEAELESRFVGCLLGLALGDALGSPFEGQPTDIVRRRFRNAEELWDRYPPGELSYTDDTQMAIGVAETLIQCGGIDQNELCRRFAENYRPQRGYGGHAKRILQAMVDGLDHRSLAENLLPGGSFGNGAAMRVAPLGVFFRNRLDKLPRETRESAIPTHTHPLAIEGAKLIALAAAVASKLQRFDREEFLETLANQSELDSYSGALRRAAKVNEPRDLCLFGNGVDAASSVVTAIACFSLTPNSYLDTVANAILLGGDTDTIAAMAGALCGAYLGEAALPQTLLARLENGHQGRDFLEDLARRLFRAAHS